MFFSITVLGSSDTFGELTIHTHHNTHELTAAEQVKQATVGAESSSIAGAAASTTSHHHHHRSKHHSKNRFKNKLKTKIKLLGGMSHTQSHRTASVISREKTGKG